MNFGEILTKAWKIIWKFKVLWIFGILSSCGQGGGGNGGGGGNTGVQFSGRDPDIPPNLRHFFYNLENFFDNIQGWQIAAMVIGLILFFLILGLILSAISTVGRIGLIQGTVEAEGGVERMTFGELFNSGKPYFWRVFGFNFLAGFAIFIIVLLLLIPLIAMTALTFGVMLICLIPFICLLVPVGWLVSIIFEQVNIAIVVEDLNIIEGLKRGWEVFRENIGNMVVMGLILGIGGFIVGLILAVPMFMITIPLVIGVIGGSAYSSDFLFGGGIAVAILCILAYLPVILVLGGILEAYIKTAWTLTYLQLTGVGKLKIETDIQVEGVESSGEDEEAG
jgi:hypothetical protein